MARGKAPSKCAVKAKHRAAQSKYVKAAPKAQAARVKKSETKAKAKARAKGGEAAVKAVNKPPKGAGKHGHKLGRPREGSCA